MKEFFKKLAGMVVTYYANRLYKNAVKEAEKVHALKKERIYVVSSLTNVSNLVILNRDKFRLMKKALRIQNHYIDNLKEGAWYYTADRAEKNGLSEQDREVRRLAFVRHMLHRAKL